MTFTDGTTLTTVLDSLFEIGQSSCAEAAYIANKTIEYTNSFKNNEINKTELNDLLADLKVDQMVANTAQEQELKSAIQTNIAEIITLASAAF